MMKMTGKAFAKKLFGAKYERLSRMLLIDLIVFWGLYIAGWSVQIAPSVRILMISAFTAGVMWQALSSKDTAVEMQHMLMLPSLHQEFVFSYVAILGVYTIFTKTATLLAILLAVSIWKPIEILGLLVCAIHAVLMAAAVYSLKKFWCASSLWAASIIMAIVLLGNKTWLILVLVMNGIFAVQILRKVDGYDFYRQESEKSYIVKRQRRGSLWWYFFRYLGFHKNYLINTFVMWCIALILPYFLGEIGSLSMVPVGFAVLSLNTPVCILLSCDRDLEQAVRFLPGQVQMFCIPYVLFLFLCNMTADVIFLCSLQIQNSSVTVSMIFAAVFFALQSAVLSVLLEWFYPIRAWKIESDLWHHPRKYIVPVTMLLLAGVVIAWPALLPVLMILLAIEVVVLFFILWKIQ